MLSFGLTLLGGCAATTTSGAPDSLYFLSRSCHHNFATTFLEYVYTARNTTPENMAASAHNGIFIAENIIKKGARHAGACWGITGEVEANTIYYGGLNLSLAGKNYLTDGSINTNINWTSTQYATKDIGAQPSLYKSGAGRTSPLFDMRLSQGVLHVTDSFSGEEKTQEIRLQYDVVAKSKPTRFVAYGLTNQASYDFIVSAYRNEGLAVNQLALPMLTAPASFGGGNIAVFEFQTKHLIEL